MSAVPHRIQRGSVEPDSIERIPVECVRVGRDPVAPSHRDPPCAAAPHPAPVRNVAAYAFTVIDDPHALRARAEAGALLGTILVTPEGVNLFLAGARDDVEAFMASLRADPRFARIQAKASDSAAAPFGRLKARVKAQLVPFRTAEEATGAGRAPSVAPRDLARWIARGADDAGRRLVLLDTRNREEVAHGTFAGATTLPIDNFADLPDAVRALRGAWADATVVGFCTGGIRCEKAVPWMRAQGMDNVLQLDGGILGYFEAVGGAGYDGACFVFDARVALDPALAPVAQAAHPAHPGMEARAHG